MYINTITAVYDACASNYISKLPDCTNMTIPPRDCINIFPDLKT